MKCVIVYFTQTGNTEKVAYAVQKGVEKASCQCDLIKIKDANPRRLYEYDLIGLGMPVFGVEPGNMAAFIRDMRFVGGKHAFAFCTHGTLPDLIFGSLVPKMKSRGLVVIGTRDWYGSCYLSHCPKPYPTDGHPDEIDFKEAEDFGKQMVENSLKITAGDTSLIPPAPAAPDMPKPDWLINVFKNKVKFYKEKCLYPKCRLCMDNCPMDGIDLSMDPPVLFKPCIDCEFCTKLCPTGAIDINDEYGEYVTEGFENDMNKNLLPILDKAETAGHFRRLVPKEKVGWDTSVARLTRGKHPQWIIGKGLQ
jgi:flavodoxin/Fe-S-cluster-containing hydrogenase component 2